MDLLVIMFIFKLCRWVFMFVILVFNIDIELKSCLESEEYCFDIDEMEFWFWDKVFCMEFILFWVECILFDNDVSWFWFCVDIVEIWFDIFCWFWVIVFCREFRVFLIDWILFDKEVSLLLLLCMWEESVVSVCWIDEIEFILDWKLFWIVLFNVWVCCLKFVFICCILFFWEINDVEIICSEFVILFIFFVR